MAIFDFVMKMFVYGLKKWRCKWILEIHAIHKSISNLSHIFSNQCRLISDSIIRQWSVNAFKALGHSGWNWNLR